jgi:hypothetical protein
MMEGGFKYSDTAWSGILNKPCLSVKKHSQRTTDDSE